MTPSKREAVNGPPAASANRLTEADLTDFDLSQWGPELLDTDGWGEILEQFGRTMKLAVALTDTRGHLLGPCHNPQPVWRLATLGRAGTPLSGLNGACPFCLSPQTPCNAIAEALATGETVYVEDQAGLAHAAIPLFLGSRQLGTLLAGQTLAHYPRITALERVASHFGAPPQGLWNAAIHQTPVGRNKLRLYAELLESLGQAFLRQRYAAILARKLHQTNERYRLIIEGSKRHALITLDGFGRVTSWNPGAERMTGYTESEIVGKNYTTFFTPEDIAKGVPPREIPLVEQSGWVEHEGWRVRKDGTRFLSETITATLGEGDAREYGKLLHDVTEERRSAEAVLQAQKLESIGVLAGGIAHDFNNLLTSILGNVSLAMVGMPVDDAARPLLDIAERSGRKAARLIAQLLSYAGTGDIARVPFDLSLLIAEILPLIQTSIPKTVQVDLCLPADLPWIDADATEIEQIVMNLLINGAEAIGPAGGILRVSTAKMAIDGTDGVCVEVRDSGCGMDDETQRKIFDPFFTTKFTGRGLGLAAVAGIVRRLKGQLHLESAPGAGSTFRIVLPGVAPEAREKTAPDKRAPDATRPVRRMPPRAGVILVVDDDPMVLGLACTVLKRQGYSTLTAEHGRAAVELFRTHSNQIDAVLMDLTMPVMGGSEAFRLMSEIRPEIPVVISSGYGESAIREQFSTAPAAVIRKPYTVAELREKIVAVIGKPKPPAREPGSASVQTLRDSPPAGLRPASPVPAAAMLRR